MENTLLITRIIFLLGIWAVGLCAVGLATFYLRKKSILDHPNERSSHTIPTPRGGGLGIMLSILPAWLMFALSSKEFLSPDFISVFAVFFGAVLLAVISWLDDKKSLNANIRLLAQAIAILPALFLLSPDKLVFGGHLPLFLDRLLTFGAWIWFVNLFNFMDGIDGIASVEAISIVAGMIIFSFNQDSSVMALSLAIAGASAAFMAWNWHPAKVFMGDVGSVPLGYLLAWLLINLAIQGFFVAAIILPLYFVADATITLVKRLLNGEKIWQAHKKHFYQRAVQNGFSHSQVSVRIAIVNAVLILCAIGSLYSALDALLVASIAVISLFIKFSKRAA